MTFLKTALGLSALLALMACDPAAMADKGDAMMSDDAMMSGDAMMKDDGMGSGG